MVGSRRRGQRVPRQVTELHRWHNRLLLWSLLRDCPKRTQDDRTTRKSSSLSIAADTRRIVPARRLLKADGSLDDNDRTEIGPTPLAFAEWSQLGLEAPQLTAMREYRLQRLTDQLVARDVAGILLFDPLTATPPTPPTCSCGPLTIRPVPALSRPAGMWCCGTFTAATGYGAVRRGLHRRSERSRWHQAGESVAGDRERLRGADPLPFRVQFSAGLNT